MKTKTRVIFKNGNYLDIEADIEMDVDEAYDDMLTNKSITV